MKLGAVFPHHEIGTNTRDLRDYAQGLESLGVDHVLIYDHVLGAHRDRPGGFQGPYDKDVRFREPFTTFAFMAAITEKIELVTTVVILPQRQTALVAKQAAEVALLSDNRLRLGVGSGWNAVEYEALDIPFAGRGKRMTEQVDLLRKLWAEDYLTYEGDQHTVTLANINPRPTQTIPIWMGGGSPAALKRCARMGDGWMPITGPSKRFVEGMEVIQAEREAAGRADTPFGVQGQIQAANASPEEWAEVAGKWRELGASHAALATHNAGAEDVAAHLKLVEAFLTAAG